MDDSLDTFYAERESVIDEKGYNLPLKETKMEDKYYTKFIEDEYNVKENPDLDKMFSINGATQEELNAMATEWKDIQLIGYKSSLSSVFQDQEKMMLAYGQTVDKWNDEQAEMYLKLIEEEFDELQEACLDYGNCVYGEASQDAHNDAKTEILDALIDILVVTIGAGLSMGFDVQKSWEEVLRSNLAKIDPETGKVRKRDDGKVLKPDGWTPPNLKQYINRSK